MSQQEKDTKKVGVSGYDHPIVQLAQTQDPATGMYATQTDLRYRLQALRKEGVDFDPKNLDKPIAHYLAEIQGTKLAQQLFMGQHRTPGDKPMNDLAIYAEYGVEFRAKGSDGRSTKDVAFDAFRHVGAMKEPKAANIMWSLRPGSMQAAAEEEKDPVNAKRLNAGTVAIREGFGAVREVQIQQAAADAFEKAKKERAKRPKTNVHIIY